MTNPADSRLDELSIRCLSSQTLKDPAKASAVGRGAHNPVELRGKLAWVLEHYRQPVLIEEFLPGREFTVALIGNENPRILPVMEILPGDQCPAGYRFCLFLRS